MIYLKNNTETQAIYIPRQTVLGGGYIPSTKAYEKGYNDGFEDGKEQQKDKLSSLHVAENGQYEREDGWNVVTVDVPDLNGSYNEGYEQGKTDGIDEQKGKLESISITENGVYSKEDGYNHIEVNVPDLNGSYEEGQADMAAKARVLNVTKNGTYLSKYSESIIPTTVTGVYADGTDFYNYAYLEGISYDSGFIVSEDMEVEIWWKGDVSKTDKNLFGSQVNNNYAIFKIRIPDTAYRFDGEIAMRQVTYRNAESNRWYHFKMSYADGFWADGVKIGDFSANISGTPYKLYINSNTPYSFNGANGYFGMIKITTNGVKNIIIPTAEGLKNITTDEMLQVVQDGTYTFTENLPIYGEGELYKTINVNVPDLNGSYDEGKTDGINEQKSKLETINITENGTYTKEDGYNKIIVKVPDLNGSYDEGYEQGQADIATNAKVLNVTENGVYKTKFSDPIVPELVTGVYADGTDFYSYAELKGKVFNTNIPATMDSRVELWYKGDNLVSGDGYNNIIATNDTDNSNIFEIIYWASNNDEVRARIGSSQISANWDETKWHHIIVSVSDGFVIDGEKKGDILSNSNIPNGRFMINGTYDLNSLRNANGCFGMIKIDDVVIIPTAEGFKNVNTGELLEVVKDGGYTFTKNLPTYGEGEIYKTINVNVPTEAVSCNLEDKSVIPSMSDRDNNGLIVVNPSEGYNGLSRTVIDPQTLYNEGVEAGRAEGGSCNLGETEFEFGISDFNDIFELSSSDEGYDGWSKVTIKFFKGDWANIYNAGKIFEDYNNGNSPGVGNYGYVCGKITEIQEVNTSVDNNYASFTLDNCFKVDKCKWAYWHYNRKEQFESEDQIKVGACAVVFGVFQDNNGSLQFEGGTSKIIAYEECVCPSAQEQAFDYDTTAFTYKVYDWTSVSINRDNITNDCNNRPLDCLLLRNRNGECTVMTKLDTCSGVVRLENGWNGDSVILSLKSNSITKFSSNSINSNQLTSIDTGFAQLEGNAITNCNALTDIKVTVVNNDLSNKYAANCFNGLPAEGTITIRKSGSAVTLTVDEITSFFRTIVGEGWTITIE